MILVFFCVFRFSIDCDLCLPLPLPGNRWQHPKTFWFLWLSRKMGVSGILLVETKNSVKHPTDHMTMINNISDWSNVTSTALTHLPGTGSPTAGCNPLSLGIYTVPALQVFFQMTSPLWPILTNLFHCTLPWWSDTHYCWSSQSFLLCSFFPSQHLTSHEFIHYIYPLSFIFS